MADVRVLIVDDQVLMREGLRKLLETEDGITVVGEARDGCEALARVAHRPPDVVLVDARMPRMDGVELIHALSTGHPGVAAIMLSTFDDDDYVLGGLAAGARGYLLKDTSPDALADAIRRVHTGQTVLDPTISGQVVAGLGKGSTPPHTMLSPREEEVAQLAGEGASNREIARRLCITEGTTKNHISSILRKLDLRDRVHLVLHLTRERRPHR